MEELETFLGWSSILGLVLILWWGVWILLAGEFVYRWHSKFCPITKENFWITHYAGIALVKIIWLMFFVIPYLALCIIA